MLNGKLKSITYLDTSGSHDTTEQAFQIRSALCANTSEYMTDLTLTAGAVGIRRSPPRAELQWDIPTSGPADQQSASGGTS